MVYGMQVCERMAWHVQRCERAAWHVKGFERAACKGARGLHGMCSRGAPGMREGGCIACAGLRALVIGKCMVGSVCDGVHQPYVETWRSAYSYFCTSVRTKIHQTVQTGWDDLLQRLLDLSCMLMVYSAYTHNSVHAWALVHR